MGDLPPSRLAEGAPPFSYALWTILVPLKPPTGAIAPKNVGRIIHLPYLLSAGDFLLILRRFVGLYGKSVKIHSDNGTNFIGGERELRDTVEQLHQDPAASL